MIAMMTHARFFFVGLLSLTLGCAAGISSQTRSQVTYNGPFSALQGAPQRYVGEVVLLGGKIIETKPSSGTSEITILQLNLDSQVRPEDNDRSEGRFVVKVGQFLDPAIYKPGALFSLVGRVTGSEIRPVGEVNYVYPVLQALEIKLWSEPARTSPSFHFGIGIGTWF